MWKIIFRDDPQINEWKISQVGDWSSEFVILEEPENKHHDQTTWFYITKVLSKYEVKCKYSLGNKIKE